VGSMTVLLLAVYGNIARMKYVWTPFSLQLHRTTIGCGAICVDEDLRFPPQLDHSPTVRCFLYAYYGNPYQPPARASCLS
jgi:hypothetical protein